jgi:hypothetical protein
LKEDDLVLTAGDYTTIQAIHDHAAIMNLLPKSVYLAVSQRLKEAGFDKHDGQDDLFKYAELTDAFGVPKHTKLQSFFRAEEGNAAISERMLSVSRILFSGAPAWATDVRKIYNYFAWTNGADRYLYFTGKGPSGTRMELSRFSIYSKRKESHPVGAEVKIDSGWYNYSQSTATELPPIGQKVQGFVAAMHLWMNGTVKFHDDHLAVVKMDDDSYESFNHYGLRPLDWEERGARHQWKQKVIEATKWEDTGALDQLYDLLLSGAVPMPG